jgi:hypothetical protein
MTRIETMGKLTMALIRKVQVTLKKPPVGAASSREIK